MTIGLAKGLAKLAMPYDRDDIDTILNTIRPELRSYVEQFFLLDKTKQIKFLEDLPGLKGLSESVSTLARMHQSWIVSAVFGLKDIVDFSMIGVEDPLVEIEYGMSSRDQRIFNRAIYNILKVHDRLSLLREQAIQEILNPGPATEYSEAGVFGAKHGVARDYCVEILAHFLNDSPDWI
jgi:hypothetical protein